MSDLPRGFRDNNPGNIDKSSNVDWVGESDKEPGGSDIDPRFVTFDKPEDGIAAIMKIMRTYETKYQLNTVAKLIGRWAPPSENPTQHYALFVANKMGVTTTDVIDVTSHDTAISLAKAIVQDELGPSSRYTTNENGEFTSYPEAWYGDDVYEKAFELFAPAKEEVDT